jgi:prepilin signal peptidase PulO-like enzyme (type II secretory pathway)
MLAFTILFSLNLLALGYFDWRKHALPVEWMIVATALFGGAAIWLGRVDLVSSLIGLVIGFCFLAVQVIVSKGKWMGWGDPWVGAMIGAVLGWPGIGISLYITYLVGGIVAVIFLLTGQAKRGMRIPFAPLLAAGALITLWFGPAIQHWIQVWF